MGIESKVAVANLSLIGLALVVILLCMISDPERWQATIEVAHWAIAVLGFPIGSFGLALALRAHGSYWDYVVEYAVFAAFLITNAYMWGGVVGAVVRWRDGRKARRRSDDSDSSCS